MHIARIERTIQLSINKFQFRSVAFARCKSLVITKLIVLRVCAKSIWEYCDWTGTSIQSWKRTRLRKRIDQHLFIGNWRHRIRLPSNVRDTLNSLSTDTHTPPETFKISSSTWPTTPTCRTEASSSPACTWTRRNTTCTLAEGRWCPTAIDRRRMTVPTRWTKIRFTSTSRNIRRTWICWPRLTLGL